MTQSVSTQAQATQPQCAPFDFDAWMALAARDPEAFERQRREILDQAIADAPERLQKRLTGLQWRIDTERRLARNPLSSCIGIYEKMWSQVYDDGGLLDQLNRFCDAFNQPRPEEAPARPGPRATKDPS
ncbi:MAG: DUF3135 domain-containing protein [Gammaproteobacteria bacterium]|nr:DUF3135 domain-containing protein [Gammaproteobacteria bacterium]